MTAELWSSTDTQRHRFSRRQLVTAGVLSDTRRAPRSMTIAAAAITRCGSGQRHTGLVRDLSATGMFVYSNFKPQPGDALELLLRLSKQGSRLTLLACKGTVVRVEEAKTGAAFGIAIEIAGYELLIDGKPAVGSTGFAAISERLRAGGDTAA